jgi:MerR family transcriptional regulator/heat shock protein HspR
MASGMRRVRRETISASIDEERGVFMISIAAELAHMHPQTLRTYEARGLIAPQRSPKNTRLYSQRDVERLRRIQQLTSEQGLNLAGVETVLEMEARVEKLGGELSRLRRRTEALERRLGGGGQDPPHRHQVPVGERVQRLGRAHPLDQLAPQALALVGEHE